MPAVPLDEASSWESANGWTLPSHLHDGGRLQRRVLDGGVRGVAADGFDAAYAGPVSLVVLGCGDDLAVAGDQREVVPLRRNMVDDELRSHGTPVPARPSIEV